MEDGTNAVRLNEQQASRLKTLTAQQGISVSAAICRCVVSMLADREARERAIAAAGRFDPGTGDLAARHDDYPTQGKKYGPQPDNSTD